MYCPVTGEGVADDFVVDVDKGEGHVGALGEEGACESFRATLHLSAFGDVSRERSGMRNARRLRNEKEGRQGMGHTGLLNHSSRAPDPVVSAEESGCFGHMVLVINSLEKLL